ncbi:MAG TPA: cobyric acid synthase, partial [Polyangia bacterium]|nr:cobyric acid synthase [Polyangia bacterium]
LGQVREDLARVPWRERSARLWPFAHEALHALLRDNELVVIEGAGSPAEINLHAADFVNMRTAREANAACLLVADIDRGGAFAHLFGTHQLLPADERALVRAFVLNKFRGDAALLPPGPEELRRLTGVPTRAVLPLWRGHGLPEEDGVYDRATTGDGAPIACVVILAFPRISNLDEYQPLRDSAGLRVRWATTAADLEGADWIILPGSKHVSGDRAWMRAQGLDDAILRHAARGGRVLGVCGGLQMLGSALVDPHGVDGDARGLALLPVETRFERHKLLRETRCRFDAVTGVWRALADVAFDGYEIHHGRTVLVGDADIAIRNDAGDAIGWQRGSVLGLYAHGLFESPDVMRALFGAATRPLDDVFDGLADFVDRHFDPGALMDLARGTA